MLASRGFTERFAIGFARAFRFLFKGAFRAGGWLGKGSETVKPAGFASPGRGEGGGEDRGEERGEARGEECWEYGLSTGTKRS